MAARPPTLLPSRLLRLLRHHLYHRLRLLRHHLHRRLRRHRRPSRSATVRAVRRLVSADPLARPAIARVVHPRQTRPRHPRRCATARAVHPANAVPLAQHATVMAARPPTLLPSRLWRWTSHRRRPFKLPPRRPSRPRSSKSSSPTPSASASSSPLLPSSPPRSSQRSSILWPPS